MFFVALFLGFVVILFVLEWVTDSLSL